MTTTNGGSRNPRCVRALAAWSTPWSIRLFTSFLEAPDAARVAVAMLENHAQAFTAHGHHRPIERDWPMVSRQELVYHAAAHGCWYALLRMRHRQPHGAHTRDALSEIEAMRQLMQAGGRRCPRAMLQARWQHAFAPMSYPPRVLYEAARYGNLEAVIFLHSVRKEAYDPHTAAKWAALSGHVAVAEWVLTHGPPPTQWTHRADVVMPAAASQEGVVIWSRGHCASPRHGFLSMHGRGTPSLVAAVAATGDTTLLQILLSTPHTAVMGTPQAIDTAARFGQMAVVQWLHRHWSMPCTQHTLAHAAWSGNLALMRWVVAHSVDGPQIHYMTLYNASECGHLEAIRWLLARTVSLHGSERVLVRDAAIRGGNLEIVRSLEQTGCITLDPRQLMLAAKFGHRALVQWLLPRFAFRIEGETGELVNGAAKSGDLELVRWLVEEYALWSSRAFVKAAQNGHVHVMAYLWATAESDHSGDITDTAAAPITANVRGNDYAAIRVFDMVNEMHFEAVEWLWTHVPQVDLYWAPQHFSFLTTMARRHREVFPAYDARDVDGVDETEIYLRSKHPRYRMIALLRRIHTAQINRLVRVMVRSRPQKACAVPQLLDWVIQSELIDVIDFLLENDLFQLSTTAMYDKILKHSHDAALMRRYVTDPAAVVDARALQWTARYGFVKLGLWIARERLCNNPAAIFSGFVAAAKYGCLELLQAFHGMSSVMECLRGQDTWQIAVKQAVAHDRYAALAWLLTTFPPLVVSKRQDTELVDLAARHGQLECLRLLTAARFALKGSLDGVAQAVGHGHVKAALLLGELQPELESNDEGGVFVHARALLQRYENLFVEAATPMGTI